MSSNQYPLNRMATGPRAQMPRNGKTLIMPRFILTVQLFYYLYYYYYYYYYYYCVILNFILQPPLRRRFRVTATHTAVLGSIHRGVKVLNLSLGLKL